MYQTNRSIAEQIDNIIGSEFKVLDHGFVRVIDYMGNDSAIVQAARVSYGSGTKTPSNDEALIRYLMRHDHTSPFEMCEIKLHIKLPIFIARQWIRHRTASVNEYSARYSVAEDDFYVPSKDSLMPQSEYNKQCRGVIPIDETDAELVQRAIEEKSKDLYNLYQSLLGSKDPKDIGVAREIARMVLSTNFYTQWYWKIDLHNLMHFLNLRMRDNAQYEIREYAKCIYENILKPWLPVTAKAFEDYKLNSYKLSAMEFDLAKYYAGHGRDEVGEYKPDNMSEREYKEFNELFDIEID